MTVAALGQLNLEDLPSWGSRDVDCFEKLEQIGEGTYGPPELLLGATKYAWLLICGLLVVYLLNFCTVEQSLPGKSELDQLMRIFELCVTPDEVNWPGASELPWYNNFKPSRPVKSQVREVFKHFGPHALQLLERMLTLDPSQRISALDALNSEYFWVDPLPCDPKSLPKYESSHEFQARKKLQQQLQHEERQKLEHPQTHACLHPFQQTWQPHPPIRPDPGQPIHGAQPQISTYASHHYGKPRGPSGGWGRYRGGGNHCFGGNNPNHPHRGGQGGPYISCPYPPQGRGPSCIGSNMPGTGASRGGASFGGSYGAGGPNYPQGGPFGASGAVRGPSMGGYCNQPYNCWQ